MSEAEPEQRAGRQEIWIEKYRPRTLDDIVGQETIIERLQSYVDRNDLPHLLLSGQAGIGKCVTGETPVLTGDGLSQIADLVGTADGFSEPDSDQKVLTFTADGEFEYVSPSHVYGKEADSLVSVETRDGGSMTVTPEHKLLVLTSDGLNWAPAADVSDGDRIVRPLQAPLPETDEDIDWVSSMSGERTLVHVTEEFASRHEIPAEEDYIGKKKESIRRFRKGDDLETIADAVDTPRKTVEQYVEPVSRDELSVPSTTCSLSYLRQLGASRAELQQHVESIQYVNRNNHRSRPIVPPWSLSPTLARFIGLAISEARLEGGRIKFYNSDDRLIEQFESATRDLFALETSRGVSDGVPYVEIGSRTLTHYLESCFDVFASATGDDTAIGSTLLRGSEESRTAFLQAMYDAEGHVTEGGIVELTQKNGRLITLLSYLLAGFGIPSRRSTDWKAASTGSGTEREYHTLYVSGSANLKRFAEAVGFTIETKQRRLSENATRTSNPNHDTMPVQSAVDDLCERLALPKGKLLTETLNPESPGRENYEEDIERVLDAASEKLETAQAVRQRIRTLSRDIATIDKIPALWVGQRDTLEPLETRSQLTDVVDVRKDCLLEYADGRRTPTARRTEKILTEIGSIKQTPDIEQVQSDLQQAVDRLNIPYSRVAEETELLGSEVSNLLENEDHDLRSLSRFETVADRIEQIASELLSMDVLETIRSLNRLATADLYFDEVETVERVDEERRVYDLTVPETRNYVAGFVPTVMHNTTSAQAVARELYGDDWQENFLELNASDQRGIDVVRERIKTFARSSFGSYDYRIIFLDEADSLCVPPGTEVVTGYPSAPEVKSIEEVAEDGEPIPSVDFETNEIQSDEGKLVDSGVADFFELELADGRTITASLTHPFFVVGETGRLVEKELHELAPGDEIADFREDVGVSQCDVCGDWTAGRFCSLDCKNEGHSREMQGEGNPMHGTEWSDERREKIVEKLSDGMFAGENNPNHGGDFHGVHVWEMDEETVEEVRETLSEKRSGTPWEEWVVDADAETVKEQIGESAAEWWDDLDDGKKAELVEKATEACDYPVCDITGDNNPMRDPEVAQKVSEALQGHEPTGGNIRHSEELGHLVRSDWEYEVAKALQDAGIEYEYEPEFELSETVFRPDFLLEDTVIEVKGSAELWGQTEKVEEFLDTYGDEYTFVVVGDKELPHHEHYGRDEFDPAVVSDGGLQAVETVEVTRIDYSHRGEAYNISMEGTPNFMLGNGVLTHNTSDAQSALRRTMEQFSNNVRFILSCNYSSQIIDPIQSRCAVFRFSPLSDEAVAEQIRIIAEEEDIEVTDDGLDALVYAADGDMRKAINGLQAAAVTGDVVDEEAVYAITSTARPEEIEEMVTEALGGDFLAARSTLDELLTDEGIAGGDVIDQLHRSVWEFDLDDDAAVRLLDRIGEADYRITEGANERIQLEALLASLALDRD